MRFEHRPAGEDRIENIYRFNCCRGKTRNMKDGGYFAFLQELQR